MRTFLCGYKLNGSYWQFELAADSFEDAHARLMSIRQTGSIDGVLQERFPAWQLPFRLLWRAISGGSR